jgi:hemerythrin-like domain-containing protein
MLIEHKHSRELSGEFKAKINSYPNEKDYKPIIDLGNSFIRLLSEHIDKEENILFNMADMQLSREEKHGIMEKMLTIK